jgi:AraC-like DNA-binding protein
MNTPKPQQLNPLEFVFKTLYEKYPDRHLERPHHLKDIQDCMNEALALSNDFNEKIFVEYLNEELAIDPELDVACYEHLRYMPAILHQQEYFEILYVMHGQCEYTLQGKTYIYESGDICITNPRIERTTSCFNEYSNIIYILIRASTFEKTFSGILGESDLLTDFFLRALTGDHSLPFIRFKTGKDYELEKSVTQLQTALGSTKRYKKRMTNAILNLFLVQLLQSHDKHMELPLSRDYNGNPSIICLIQYIQENYQHVTLQQLSKIFNFTPRHIQRLILSSTGKSFQENIIHLRMTKAKQLLKYCKLSVEQIALHVGYSNASNFRFAFKRCNKITPQAYRKSSFFTQHR